MAKNGIEVKVEPTATEIQITQMLANEMTAKQIGDARQKSHRTIQVQIENVRKKFGCKSSIGLVVLFFRNKLIE